MSDSASSSSAPLQAAAVNGAAVGKVDESRSSAASTATGIGGVQTVADSYANTNTNTNTGSTLPQPAADEGEGVSARGAGGGDIDGSGAGTLAMNSPASDNAKRFSSSSSSLQSALRPVENASSQDSRPSSVPKDKRSSRPGTGEDGARTSSGSSHRRRREGHEGSGGGEGGSSEGTQGERRSRKSRSGGGSGGDPSRSRRKDEREGQVDVVQI